MIKKFFASCFINFSFFLFFYDRFRIENPANVIDVNRNKLNPFDYDQVNIICPHYPKGTRTDDSESYIIYNVSKSLLTNIN